MKQNINRYFGTQWFLPTFWNIQRISIIYNLICFKTFFSSHFYQIINTIRKYFGRLLCCWPLCLKFRSRILSRYDVHSNPESILNFIWYWQIKLFHWKHAPLNFMICFSLYLHFTIQIKINSVTFCHPENY